MGFSEVYKNTNNFIMDYGLKNNMRLRMEYNVADIEVDRLINMVLVCSTNDEVCRAMINNCLYFNRKNCYFKNLLRQRLRKPENYIPSMARPKRTFFAAKMLIENCLDSRE